MIGAKTYVLGVLALLFVACAQPFSQVPGAVKIEPPEHFADLYSEVEACLARDGDYDRVTWWAITGYHFERDGLWYEALWSEGHHITLSAWNALDKVWMVKHEIAHDLGYSKDAHEDPQFVECTDQPKKIPSLYASQIEHRRTEIRRRYSEAGLRPPNDPETADGSRLQHRAVVP